MLFMSTRSLAHEVELATRVTLLERLQAQGLTPLIRSARLHAYGLTLPDAARAPELERALASTGEAAGEAAYVRGDLFCFADFIHFLLFDDETTAAVRAGIIYESDTAAPQQLLDAFCRKVSDALGAARDFSDLAAASALAETEWQMEASALPESFTRFATDAADTSAQQHGRSALSADWLRVAGTLENTEARQVLRGLVEAQQQGRGGTSLAGKEGEGVSEPLLARLTAEGLVKREILVSCRKDGRALFRLPSPDALNVLHASNAICSECGAAITDEKADEIIVPTSLTNTLLQDGSWLTTHLRSILLKLGLPEEQISTRPVSGEGESLAMAHLCGAAFLFLLRDGDWTATHARHALDEQAQTGATHLVIIATGKIHEEARQRLREQTRRRAQGGHAMDVLCLEGVEAVAPELEHLFARVTHAKLNEELWPLDASLGLNVAQLVTTRFGLAHKTGALRELAASAAGAVAGSLREF